MVHNEGNFASLDGCNLYYQSWRAEHDHEAIIAIVHGSGEHSGRYVNICNYFLAKPLSNLVLTCPGASVLKSDQFLTE